MIAAHQLIEDQDRKLTEKELLSASCILSLPTKASTMGKSPRSKFLKTELAAQSTSPRFKTGQHQHSTMQTFVSVQEPPLPRDWTGFSPRVDKYENFKSPSLFWEIRLQESKLATEKAARPTVSQIIQACDVLEEYSNRLASQGDTVFPAIKEQVGQRRPPRRAGGS
jgi:hypothetical protein